MNFSEGTLEEIKRRADAAGLTQRQLLTAFLRDRAYGCRHASDMTKLPPSISTAVTPEGNLVLANQQWAECYTTFHSSEPMVFRVGRAAIVFPEGTPLSAVLLKVSRTTAHVTQTMIEKMLSPWEVDALKDAYRTQDIEDAAREGWSVFPMDFDPPPQAQVYGTDLRYDGSKMDPNASVRTNIPEKP